MASVSSHGGTPPSSPRNGSTSATAEPGAGAVGGPQQVEQAERAGSARRRPSVDEPSRAAAVDLRARRRASCSATHVRRPCGRGWCRPDAAAGLVDRVEQRLRDAAAPPLRARAGSSAAGRRGSRPAAARARRALPRLGDPARRRRGTSVRNGGVCAASTRATSGSRRRRRRAPTSTSSTTSERSSSPTSSSTSEPHRVAQHDLVVALQQDDRDGASVAAHLRRAASRTAAMTSAVRRAPRTSWARRIRQPSAMPSAWAACVASRRSVTSVPSSVAEEPLVRRRQEHRVAERRPAGRSRAAARATAARSCRGRGRRRP